MYFSPGQKVLYTGSFMLVALVPSMGLAFVALAILGPEAALVAVVGGLLAAMGYYLWKLRVVEQLGRFTFFADRVESVFPHQKRLGTELRHEMVRYADVGHIERTSLGVVLRHGSGSGSSGQMVIQFRPEHRDSAWEELVERMERVATRGSVFSLREGPEGPMRYSREGEPLDLLLPGPGVSGGFRFASPESNNRWEVRASEDARVLVRIRRESISQGDSEEWNWFVESAEGELLAYIWKSYQAGATAKFEVYGPRGVELGRMTVRRTLLTGPQVELLVGEQTLRWVSKDGAFQVEQDGRPLGRVECDAYKWPKSGVLTKPLPFSKFVLVVTVAAMATV
jgi:hypothetical protein